MKLNEKTVISGNLVVLVPYENYHVPKYHDWMKSKELQILTASEPLTLEEEYNMQQTWRNDSDKCTFIILDKARFEESGDEVYAMIGDTNIFLKNVNSSVTGEIEIMIAENWARGKGLGKEAVLFMLRYGIEKLNINTYEAKIGMDNSKSIALFQKIGFEKVDESETFKEITLEKKITESWTAWILSNTNMYHINER